MRKEMIVALAALFFLSLNAMTGVFADEREQSEVISEMKEDVTGDGKQDKIVLQGVPFEEGTAFLKEIVLIIDASNGKQYKIDLDGGYEPSITFQDLNHDGVKDMLISIPTGGSGGLSNYYLYTLKDFNLVNIGLPDALVVNSEFLDDYKAKLEIMETGASYEFNLKDRAKEYKRLGLYINGKLNEPRELIIDPYGAMKPILLQNNKYGLKTVQSISGAYRADRIGYIESEWFYENGKWQLKQVKVLDSTKAKK